MFKVKPRTIIQGIYGVSEKDLLWWIETGRYMYRSDIDELREIINEALKHGVFDGATNITLFEEYEVRSDDDIKRLYNEEIPTILRLMLSSIGYNYCKVYFLTQGVSLPEYVVICKDGERYLFIKLGMDYEDWESEEEDYGYISVKIVWANIEFIDEERLNRVVHDALNIYYREV